MVLFARLRSWLRATLRRSRMEHEMDTELRAHLEHRVADLIRNGLAPDAAARLACAEFGGFDQTKEACRDARGVSIVDGVFRDLKFGARMLHRSPGFTVMGAATLALGI